MRCLTTWLLVRPSSETISWLGIKLPIIPFGVGASPLPFGSLGSSQTYLMNGYWKLQTQIPKAPLRLPICIIPIGNSCPWYMFSQLISVMLFYWMIWNFHDIVNEHTCSTRVLHPRVRVFENKIHVLCLAPLTQWTLLTIYIIHFAKVHH